MKENKKDIVLFVDDEPGILKSIERGLFKENFQGIFASTGYQALRIMEEQNVAVIVSDIRMPDMDGLELLKRVRENYPETVRIVLTGYTQVLTILAAINKGHIYRYIKKPWKMEEDFLPTIKQSIEFHHIIVDRKQMVSRLEEQNDRLKKMNDDLMKLKEDERRQNKINKQLLAQLQDKVVPYLSRIRNFTETISLSKEENIRKVSTKLKNETDTLLTHFKKLDIWNKHS